MNKTSLIRDCEYNKCGTIQRVLMIVNNTQNHSLYGLCKSSGIKKKEN
jgi:hypothetical protein